MKRASKPIFFIVVVLILVMSFLSFFGIKTENGDLEKIIIKGAGDIRWGIDISGGVEVTYYPVDDNGNAIEATVEDMDSAKTILGMRLTSNHITDYELYVDYDNSRLILRYPWSEDEENFDPEEAIKELSVSAVLTFREGYEYEEVKDDYGNVIGIKPSGDTAEKIILTGDDVTEAVAVYYNMQYGIQLELSEAGKEKFSEATGRLAKEKGVISIWLDDQLISFPTVNEQITDGQALISGDFTADTAKQLADQINAGALPFTLDTISISSINPTLGVSALEAMLIAGIIAFIAISAYVIFLYRLPGVIACIALLGQVACMIISISGFFPNSNSFTLTLPGIAGIILSIGMGIDANIITNERIREELRSGKSLDNAIARGSKESFAAIFDGNITNVIIAVIMMGVFGSPDGFWSRLVQPLLFMFDTSITGAVYSFGYTLLIGAICNLLMGVGASRVMLMTVSKFKKLRDKRLYGGESK